MEEKNKLLSEELAKLNVVDSQAKDIVFNPNTGELEVKKKPDPDDHVVTSIATDGWAYFSYKSVNYA